MNMLDKGDVPLIPKISAKGAKGDGLFWHILLIL